jgi:hypothetical protein
MLLNNRRNVQATADAAALAAAIDLFSNYGANGGLDPSGTAKASALSTAAANGFSNDGVTSVITINIPPASGSYTGQAGYAEVIVQFNQTRGFSSIYGSGALQVSGRAVACGQVGDIGILCLDDVVTTSAQICGKVNILNGGQIYINSKASVANSEFSGWAGSIYLASGAVLSTGGINLYSTSLLNNTNGGSITYTNGGSLKAFSPQITDPLANIAEPTPTGTTYGTASGGYSVTTSKTLQPGIYPGGIQVGAGSGSSSSTVNVTLAPGIYYLGSSSGTGSFSVSTGTTLTGTGVMFYNQMGDSFSPFDGTVNITPPTTGTYQGISYWQPRADAMEIHISGTANVTMPGTFYNVGTSYTTGENGGNSSTGEFDINPKTGAVFNFGNYICDQAEWQQGVGGTGGTLQMNPGSAHATQRPTLVE